MAGFIDPTAPLKVAAGSDPSYPESDPFGGPKSKIERAKRHIGDYRLAHKALTESDALRMVPEIEPGTGNNQIKIHWAKPPSSDLQLTAADAVYNLRAALDQAASCCAKGAGQSPDKTYFPHGMDEAGFEASIRQKCKNVPEPVRAAIAASEPYYGGSGQLLRALHDLNLVDKHTDLIAIAAAVSPPTVTRNVPPTGVVWKRNGDKLEIVDRSAVAEVEQHIEFTVSVTFTDVEALKGQPVTHVLYQFADLVSATVKSIEAAMLTWLASESP